MSSDSPPDEMYEEIGKEIRNHTLERLRGHDRPYCAFENPQNVYFVSSIAPRDPDGDTDGEFTESRPNLVGLKFKPESSALKVRFEFEVYVRSFPTPSEFEDIQSRVGELEERKFDASTLFFRRVDIEYTTEIDPDSVTESDDPKTGIGSELEAAIKEAVQEFSQNHIICPDPASVIGEEEEYTSPGDIEAARESLRSEGNFTPTWNLRVEARSRSVEGEISLALMNVSDQDDTKATEPFIFNPKISVSGEFERYELNLIPEDYRYDREIWGKGQNCSVESSEAGSSRTLHTTKVPRHQSYRFKQNFEFEQQTSLNRLKDPDTCITALEEIARGMEDYLDEWRGERADKKKEELTPDAYEKYLEASDNFEEEIEYFQRGIEILSQNDEALRVFTLMNESFARRDDEMDGWYLFQIVFIVSNIGSILSREYSHLESGKDDLAEVLWFPTGGGKTEAYLGLIVYALLFDRIRGKDRGVTAWIRFPLRLLSKQQKDRFLGILDQANQVREDVLDGRGEPFSVGYFVGSHDTPNSIRENGRNNYHNTFQRDQSELRSRCLVVENCPRCDGEVDVEFDSQTNTVYHVCQDDSCDLGQLPLYVTDDDIYRNIPSVLLGTLDKISIMGAQPRFTNLLGNLTDRCPVHGYGYAGKCPMSGRLDCDAELETVDETLYDPVPSLHLIDEVHLLNEELGVFAGQYETLYQELCRRAGSHDDEPKVVTSSATIAEYEKQMSNLFLKDANRFPEEGPTKDESFYGSVDEDDPEREYIGITPVNKTHIYAALDLAKQYHQTIRDYREVDSTEFDLSSDEYESILDMYELSVVYFLKKTEKDRFLRSIKNQINREMSVDGYDIPLETEQLTADIESTSALDELEDPDSPFDERADTVGATSFIGHGIDVDRFNTMIFFGFPSQTFQYIQSSARVGRKYPGGVFNLFRPYDERDKHRYKYFEKTHEYLRRSVEAISVDRWSKFSIEKTFPGVFKSVLLQHYRPLMWREYDINVQSSRQLKSVITDPDSYPEFDREEYETILKRAYGLHTEDNEYFEREIEQKTESYWDFWMKKLGAENYTTFKEEAMINLRDIGDSEEITIDNKESGFYDSLVRGE